MIVNLIPMAGEGQRFKNAGYTTAKPLLDIDGIPMFVRAAKSLPPADEYIFVCRKDQVDAYQLNITISTYFPNSKIHYIDSLTQGQAITCISAKELIPEEAVLNIGPSDSAMIYNHDLYDEFLLNSQKGALVWTIRNDQAILKNVNMYGWVAANPTNKLIESISCKVTVSNQPQFDPAIIGCFSFKKASYFFDAVQRMIGKNDTINNEFYVDIAMNHAIALGTGVYLLDVDEYIGWGTPADYENYLQRLKDYKNEG
ncbi:MAG: hypothetical protein EBX50_09890 [Chitinophagia bacterium]|nr:hypothetical protein [Chitinophagia bacterium]